MKDEEMRMWGTKKMRSQRGTKTLRGRERDREIRILGDTEKKK